MSQSVFQSEAAVVEDSRLLFCRIPKNGMTQWSQMLKLLSSSSKGYSPNEFSAHDMNLANAEFHVMVVKHLATHQAAEIHSDDTWTRAVFSRNPFYRLLSGYLDRIVRAREYFRIGVRGHDEEDPITKARVPKKGSQVNISFSEFVSTIAAQKEADMDEHFRPQSSYCGLRFAAFNFVGKFEQLGTDSWALLRKVGAERHGEVGWGSDGSQRFLEHNTHHTTNAAARAASFYTVELERVVVALFKEDFERFNYEKVLPRDVY